MDLNLISAKKNHNEFLLSIISFQIFCKYIDSSFIVIF